MGVPGQTAADLITLKIGLMEPIDSINPFIGVNDNAYIFYGLVYDYLVSVDEDRNPSPGLALSWWVIQDIEPVGSVWEFNLTTNATWHDGEPFTADDVVFTFDLQTGPYFDQFWAFQPYTALVRDVEKINDYKVRIHFQDLDDNPSPCSFGDAVVVPIVPKHVWSLIDPAEASFSYANELPIGTGPFMCTENTYDEFLSGERLILMTNHDYHLGEISFDRLILEFYLEPAAMVSDIQRGELDVGFYSAPNYKNLLTWLSEHPDAPIDTHAGLVCTSYSVEIAINQVSSYGNPTREDPAVRVAMAHATNKSFIRDQVYMGLAQTGSTILSPLYGEWYWEPTGAEVLEYDLAKANMILDDAGYVWDGEYRVAPIGHPYGSVAQKTRLSYPVLVEQELFEDKATAEYMRSDWKKIGIEIEISLVDTAQWNTQVYGGAFEIAMTYWSGDPDPNYLLYTQSTKSIGGWSETWYSSAAYDENYSVSVVEQNRTKRTEAIKNCQEIMYNDCAFIVTVYPYGCYAWRTDTFSNWGDWAAHPYRSISNYWGANPLWFDLIPGEPSDGDGGGGVSAVVLGAAAGLIIAVVVIALVLLMMRRKGGRKEEEDVQLP